MPPSPPQELLDVPAPAAHDVFTFLLTFLASPLYVYSPYLRGRLVQTVELFTPRRGMMPWRGEERSVGYSYSPPRPTPLPFYQVREWGRQQSAPASWVRGTQRVVVMVPFTDH